jgi:uncharacterized membrane protein
MAEQDNRHEKLSRSELVTALSHYYRAEVQRSLAWRERLDRTTNWAVGSTAVFLGYSYSHPEIHHAVFLFSFAIIYTLLIVESRRYRFYDAYEYRVRLMNQHFAYGILAEGVLAEDLELDGTTYWRAEIAADLKYPQYKMDFWQALGRRIYANYFPLFVILLAGWLLKIKLHPQTAMTWRDFYEQAGIGAFPGWVTFLCMLLFVLHLIGLMSLSRKLPRGQDLLHSRHAKR